MSTKSMLDLQAVWFYFILSLFYFFEGMQNDCFNRTAISWRIDCWDCEPKINYPLTDNEKQIPEADFRSWRRKPPRLWVWTIFSTLATRTPPKEVCYTFDNVHASLPRQVVGKANCCATNHKLEKKSSNQPLLPRNPDSHLAGNFQKLMNKRNLAKERLQQYTISNKLGVWSIGKMIVWPQQIRRLPFSTLSSIITRRTLNKKNQKMNWT